MHFCSNKRSISNLNIEEFHKAIGVNVNITDADVEACVDAYFKEKDEEMTTMRHTIDKNAYNTIDPANSRFRTVK